jgi:hypothetical protein
LGKLELMTRSVRAQYRAEFTNWSWKIELMLIFRNRDSRVDGHSLEFADQKGFAALADEILQKVTNGEE